MFEELLKYFKTPKPYESLIVIVLMFVILKIIQKYLVKKVAYTNKDEQHKNTFIGVIFSLFKYFVILVAIVIVLKLNGVDITSIVTGIGILATLIGLALQDTLKDLISGITIYSNNFYKVGDVVRYNNELCEVKYFNARVTKFCSVLSGSTYTVCNSCINSIEKVKRGVVVSFVFEFEQDSEKINKAIDEIVKQAEALYGVSGVANLGICNITDEGVTYLISFECSPKKQPIYKSQVIQIAYKEFKKNNLSVTNATRFNVKIDNK